jgi:hypothetical protein
LILSTVKIEDFDRYCDRMHTPKGEPTAEH